MKLTVKKVTRLKEPGRYGDGHGLYLQVAPRPGDRAKTLPSDNRSWLLRYEHRGKERWMGLGPVHTFSLDEARERARTARQQLRDGIDPLEARRASRTEAALASVQTLTFEDAARQYFAQHESKWRNAKHRAQFLSTLEQYAFPTLSKLSVASIDTGLVLKVVEPIWKTKTETANRVRGRIESVLDWAAVRGARKGDNPARWRGHLAEVLPARGQISKVQHHKALPFSDMPDFLQKLSRREGMAARALELLILTACRTGEIIGARWPEIDLASRIWLIPANRMKAHRDHRVPLSDRALEILQALPREADYVFPGGKKDLAISNMAMTSVLRRMEFDDITVHGFRSTFRDWAAERTTHANHIVEMALAHTISDKVEAAYRRGDLLATRAHLMADWARFCTTPPQEATITPIRARA